MTQFNRSKFGDNSKSKCMRCNKVFTSREQINKHFEETNHSEFILIDSNLVVEVGR